MTSTLGITLDVVSLFFAVGIIAYGWWLLRLLKGALFEKSFLIFGFGVALFVLGEFLHILRWVGFVGEPFETLHELMEFLFLVLLFAATYLVHRGWQGFLQHRDVG